MFETHRPRANTLPLARLVSSLALATATLSLAAACEDNGMGRSCNLGETIDPAQGAYSLNATDCQTRMCVKPAVQQGVSLDLDTGPYCSTTCSTDSDCQGQTRDSSNPNDRRCKRGYTCAIAFGASDTVEGGGKLCCRKICLCKDFFSASQDPAVPAECQGGSDASCSTAPHD
jgi:hypothetical protein